MFIHNVRHSFKPKTMPLPHNVWENEQGNVAVNVLSVKCIVSRVNREVDHRIVWLLGLSSQYNMVNGKEDCFRQTIADEAQTGQQG